MIKLIESIKSFCVNYSEQNPVYYGLSFYQDDKKVNRAVAASGLAVCEIIGGIEGFESPFYSFLENKWTSYKYPISLDKICGVLYNNNTPTCGVITTRYSNFCNYLSSFPKAVKEKSRIVFRPNDTRLNDGEIVMSFERKPNGDRLFFKEGIPKPFMAVEDAPIPSSCIEQERTYKVIIIGQNNDVFFVQAIEPYGPIVADMIFTPDLYDLENLPPINPAESFPFSVWDGDIEKFPNIAFDTSLLTTSIQVFNMLDEDACIDIEIHYSDEYDTPQPIMIHGKDRKREIFMKISGLDTRKTNHRR